MKRQFLQALILTTKLAFPLFIIVSVAHLNIGEARVIKKPNLTGIWKLDMEASSFTFSKRDLVYDGMILEIEHREPEIRMTRKLYKKNEESVQKLIFYSDGRSEVNPALVGSIQLKSRTVWEDDLLVSKGKRRAGAYDAEGCNVWELSADGQVLTYYILTSIPQFGVQVLDSPEFLQRGKIKEIFRKVG